MWVWVKIGYCTHSWVQPISGHFPKGKKKPVIQLFLGFSIGKCSPIERSKAFILLSSRSHHPMIILIIIITILIIIGITIIISIIIILITILISILMS